MGQGPGTSPDPQRCGIGQHRGFASPGSSPNLSEHPRPPRGRPSPPTMQTNGATAVVRRALPRQRGGGGIGSPSPPRCSASGGPGPKPSPRHNGVGRFEPPGRPRPREPNTVSPNQCRCLAAKGTVVLRRAQAFKSHREHPRPPAIAFPKSR